VHRRFNVIGLADAAFGIAANVAGTLQLVFAASS
jgi:hypothetical protein